MEVTRIDLGQWREALPSSGFEVFHDPDALAVLDEHTDAELQLFGGYKGDHPVALLPVFVSDRTIGRTVFSPPPSLSVPRLGPIIDSPSPKRRKRERINRQLVEHVVDALDLDRRTSLFRMLCPMGYDPRPYDWNGLGVSPSFTYVLDLEDRSPDDVMKDFSKSLRREMRKGSELDLSIEYEGIDTAVRIYEDVVERYREHDDSPPMSRAFVRDLLSSLDDRRWRVYAARTPDGEYKGGIAALFSNDLAYFWQGGVRATYENVSVNTLLHRAIIDDVCTDPELDSVEGYDLVGANTERLCDYKGKFNADLRPSYVVESTGVEMTLAKSAYQKVLGSRT